jgi:outer membrane protein
MTKTWPLALLLAASAGTAQAQATRMMMPEGTYDLYFGVGYQKTFEGQGGNHQVLVPALEVQWSNGVFIDANVREAAVGVYLSDDPMLNYGVVAAASGRDQRDDTPGQRGGVLTQAGAFLHWNVDHNIGVNASLMAGGGFNGGGLLAQVRAEYSMRLAAHQGASLAVGMFVADHSWQQGYFGVTAAQSANGDNPPYRARAGVLRYFGDVEWQWQPGNKYTLITGARFSRLGSSPAASPIAGSRHRVSLHTTLRYHF